MNWQSISISVEVKNSLKKDPEKKDKKNKTIMMRCTRLQKSSPSVAIIFFFTLHHTLSITLASISQAGSQHLQSINILVTEKENSYKRRKNLKNQETSMFASHILNSFISKLHVYNAQKHLASVFIPFFFYYYPF